MIEFEWNDKNLLHTKQKIFRRHKEQKFKEIKTSVISCLMRFVSVHSLEREHAA